MTDADKLAHAFFNSHSEICKFYIKPGGWFVSIHKGVVESVTFVSEISERLILKYTKDSSRHKADPLYWASLWAWTIPFVKNPDGTFTKKSELSWYAHADELGSYMWHHISLKRREATEKEILACLSCV